ncbi:hypothetical protein [Agrobacterium tumefaciens]|uniref:hypothetical protein n=1 Tax=Agrobacterium tumefaciens TaxID=358 RepID=UPI0021D29EFD|nr:hypothetical protein [Agrobacterium tumefaciens]UXS01093.1 hypothetical protein FY156_06085 [Agrobacterium tumefaciens]
MPAINISAFIGERPLIIPRLLPETAAQEAVNARLDDGGLTPIRKSLKTGEFVEAGAVTVYRHNGVWLSWPVVVDAAPGPVAQERLYFTGDGVPKMRIGADVYDLAVPRPVGALTAVASGTGDGDTQSRTYVYTYVTDFGEETGPSPASAIIDWKPGQTVTLSGFAAPVAGRQITKQRIYRSQTGSSGTYLYFIAERAATAANYIDNVAVDAFQEALPSAGWDEPPDNLLGLTVMPNGMMAAFVERSVYFSEPWRPHVWPEKYIMNCDSEVVALGAIGNVLVVMTKAHPYIMTGSHPDSMQSQKLEANFPCINARGVVDLGFSICYPTNDGLIAVGGDGSVNLVTRELFRPHDWLKLSPATAIGAQYSGAYAMFYDIEQDGIRQAGCLFVTVGATPFLIRSAEIISACYFDVADSALYFTRPGDTNIYRFDPPDGPPEMMVWRSKEWWLPRPMNFGALLIDKGSLKANNHTAAIQAEVERIETENAAIFASGQLESAVNENAVNAYPVNGDAMLPLPEYLAVSIGVFGDGKLVRVINRTDTVERLPGKSMARVWEIAVSSNVPISRIAMASSVDELRTLA